jgi:hypothetical protein
MVFFFPSWLYTGALKLAETYLLQYPLNYISRLGHVSIVTAVAKQKQSRDRHVAEKFMNVYSLWNSIIE